jgi:uncharacterized protein YggL (DUF469 family)
MNTLEPSNDQRFGFELSFRTPDGWDDAERMAFWDACIRHIEHLGLAVGGGTDLWWTVFVTSTREGNSVTPSQREALLAWLQAHPAVLQVLAGELVSA